MKKVLLRFLYATRGNTMGRERRSTVSQGYIVEAGAEGTPR